MKKYFILLILFLSSGINAQNLKFALINNLTDSREKIELNADSISQAIKRFGSVNSLVSLGNITKWGSVSQLDSAKLFLDSLNLNYKVLCGPNELKQNFSGYLNIKRFFENDNFISELGQYLLVGLQTLEIGNYEKAHLSIETIEWLKNALSSIKNKKIILLLNSKTEKVDNLNKIESFFKENSLVKIITPEYTLPRKKEIKKGKNRKKNKMEKETVEISYFHIVELRKDSLKLYSLNDDNEFIPAFSEKLVPVKISDIAPEENEKSSFSPVITVNSSSSAKVTRYKESIILSLIDGRVLCYNPDFTLKWQYKVNGNIIGEPIIADDQLIIASTQGEVIIIDPETQEILRSMGTDCEIVSPLRIIEYTGRKELFIPKTSKSNKALLFSGSTGELFCYDLETLQELWINNDSKSPLTGNLVDTGNKLVFKNCEGKIICIDSRNGLLIWRWGYRDFSADIKTGMAFNGKQIITLTDEKALNGIDLLLGVSEWQTEKEIIKDFYFNSKTSNTITALTEKYIITFDSKSGKNLKDTKLTGEKFTSFIHPDIQFTSPYLLSDENVVYKMESSKLFKRTGYPGNASIISFFADAKKNLLIFNSDGELLKTSTDQK